MNYANDDRFSKEALSGLIDEINVFIEILKGTLMIFNYKHQILFYLFLNLCNL